MIPYKAIFFDLDGTLVDSNFEIPNYIFGCFDRLKQHGFRLSIATGRSFVSAKPFLDKLNIEHSSVYSNGVVLDNPVTKKLEIVETIKTKSIEPFLDILYDLKIRYKLIDDKGNVFTDMNYPWIKKIDPSENIKLVPRSSLFFDAVKVVLFCDQACCEILLKRLSSQKKILKEYRLYRSSSYSVEVVPNNINKCVSAKKILKSWDIPISEAIAVGDQENDYEMIRDFGLGVAIENGSSANLQVAKLVIPPPEKQGIQVLLNYILNLK